MMPRASSPFSTLPTRPRRQGTTTAKWKQIITGLNEEGNRLLAGLTDEAYQQKISVLERLLNHYLTTGEMLSGGV